MTILVVDVGTSGVRAAVVGPEADVVAYRHQRVPALTPTAGVSELDAEALGRAALVAATEVMEQAGPVEAVGITAQRASTVLWDRATGRPLGPGIGWQDLRTVGACLVLAGRGIHLDPSQTATKVAHLLDAHDPDRSRAEDGELCVGTIDSWLAWVLSRGGLHVTDPSNAGVTGLVSREVDGWDGDVLDALRIPRAVLPTIVDSSGPLGPATALPGAPIIAGLAGDQQASLLGQGCVRPGMAKLTFGTGAMLDLTVGPTRPAFERKGPHGTYPVVAWRVAGQLEWGLEALALSAGSAVDWLVDLGVVPDAAASGPVADGCDDTDGAFFVPALAGLGTPVWDYGARGTLVGVSRSTGRAQLARAVLEGIAHRGADLVDAAEADAGVSLERVRVDGGMTANRTFLQALANATARPVEVSRVREATTLGAAFLAGLAVGTWSGWDEIEATWVSSDVVEPTGRLDRTRWRAAVERSRGWVPTLSGLSF